MLLSSKALFLQLSQVNNFAWIKFANESLLLSTSKIYYLDVLQVERQNLRSETSEQITR